MIAGGAESMSMTPFGGRKPAPNPWFVENWPEVYMSMGLTAERMQRKYGITREESDAFALRSHQNAVRAQAEGRFDRGTGAGAGGDGDAARQRGSGAGSRRRSARGYVAGGAGASCRPVFHAQGTVTAGNSSQTSDGAAAALVMSEREGARNWDSRRWRGSSRSRPRACRRRSWGSVRWWRFRKRW